MGLGSNNTPQPSISPAILQVKLEYALARLDVQESAQETLEEKVSRLTEQVDSLLKELRTSRREQAETQRDLELYRRGIGKEQTVEDLPKSSESALPKQKSQQVGESAATTQAPRRRQRGRPTSARVVQPASRQQKQQQQPQQKPPQKHKTPHQHQQQQPQQQQKQTKPQKQLQLCTPPQKPKTQDQHQHQPHPKQKQHSGQHSKPRPSTFKIMIEIDNMYIDMSLPKARPKKKSNNADWEVYWGLLQAALGAYLLADSSRSMRAITY